MSDQMTYAILGFLVAVVATIGLYFVYDNSIRNIPYHTALVEHCSPPANWNAPICTAQNRP